MLVEFLYSLHDKQHVEGIHSFICLASSDKIHSSIHHLSLFYIRVTEPIPADVGYLAGYTLDKSLIYHKDKQPFTHIFLSLGIFQ